MARTNWLEIAELNPQRASSSHDFLCRIWYLCWNLTWMEFAQSRRYRRARGPDRLRSVRSKLATKWKTSALEICFDLLQAIQPANDLFPFPF
jgi:hypothetical protein